MEKRRGTMLDRRVMRLPGVQPVISLVILLFAVLLIVDILTANYVYNVGKRVDQMAHVLHHIPYNESVDHFVERQVEVDRVDKTNQPNNQPGGSTNQP